MAGPIYKQFLARWTEAWYQLSPDEQRAFEAKLGAALEQAGGKGVVYCDASWSGDQWAFFGIEEFPNLEAVQKHTQALQALNWFRYCDSRSVLGTKWPTET
jgi:hypothetical protein